METSFGTGLKICQFLALDFFGDGSFYLLDVLGYTTGHISGLARVAPEIFIFFGGDVCHYGGSFLPSQRAPIPSNIPKTAMLDARLGYLALTLYLLTCIP